MNVKKIIIIIICIFIFMGVLWWFFCIDSAFTDMANNSVVVQGEEKVKTGLGDEFTMSYVTTNFPDYQTDISVFDKNRNSLEYYHLEGDYGTPNIIVLIDSSIIRCYEVNQGIIIYKLNNGIFKGTSKSEIDDEYMTKNRPELIVIAKELVAKGEWKWIEFFGEFLVKTGDSAMKENLERYSNGQFTQEELELNKNSEIKKDEMQSLAKQILEKK